MTRMQREARLEHHRAFRGALLFLFVLASSILLPGPLHADNDPPGGVTPDPDDWIIPPPPTPPEPLVPPLNPIVGTDEASAYLPGRGTVTPTGEYRYDVPIAVPPGRAGLQPHLGISYSSRGGDGRLGLGWSLSGLSEIHRCAKTFASDGRSDGVDFDETDALCIDGNRLIFTDNADGKDHYVTEKEVFARIESTPTVSGHTVLTRSFRVYAKDGRILDYAPLGIYGTPESTLSIDVVWPLTRERDRAGNEIHYTYDLETAFKSTGPSSGYHTFDYRLTRIDYGGPPGSSDVGPCTIEFAYMEREWPVLAFAKGIRFDQHHVLESIRTSVAGSQHHNNYRLKYAAGPGLDAPFTVRRRYRLAGIELETWIGDPPTPTGRTLRKEFEYDTPQPNEYQPTERYVKTLTTTIPEPSDPDSLIVLDADGDGLDDLLYSADFTHLRLSSPNAPLQNDLTFDLAGQVVDDAHPIAVDLDGDGRVEVVAFDLGDHRWHLYRFDGSTFIDDPFFPNDVALSADLGGILTGNAVLGEAPSFADLNGDGLPEMVKMFDATQGDGYAVDVRVWLNHGVAFDPPSDMSNSAWHGVPFGKDAVSVSDLFGELRGQLESLQNPVYQWQSPYVSALLMDDSGQLVITPSAPLSGLVRGVRFDVNGDGLADPEGFVSKGDGSFEFVNGGGAGLGTVPLVAQVDRQGPEEVIEIDAGDELPQGWLSWFASYEDVWITALQDVQPIDLGEFYPSTRTKGARIGDFNGDGRPDIALVTVRCIDNVLGGTLLFDLDDQTFTGDCVADGVVLPTVAELHVYLHRPDTYDDLLIGVRESGNLRESETIEYAPWAPPPGSPAATCGYPQHCARRGEITVVRSHGVINPAIPNADLPSVADYYRTYYSYEDPRSDARGGGFLGFGTTRVWDPQRPMQVTTRYRNDIGEIGPELGEKIIYPFAGVPSRVTTVIPILDVPKTGRLLPSDMPATANARVVDVETQYETEWTPQDRGHWVHPTAWESREWEEPVCITWDPIGDGRIDCIDGFDRRQPALRASTGAYYHDDYGNVIRETEQTVGGTKSEVEFTYENRVDDWLLGLPRTQSERSAKTQNDPWQTRTTSYDHDTRGLVTRVLIEPQAPDPDLRQAITYKRDVAGQVVSVRRTAPGESARFVYVQYDGTGIFPAIVWNPLGHAQWAQYEPSLGVPIVALDNLALTQWVYDGLGRVLEVTPEGSSTLTRGYALREDPPGYFSGLVVGTSTSAGDEAEVVTDELGRSIERGHIGFDSHWIREAVAYDVLGRLYSVSRPGVDAPASKQTVVHQDTLNRVTSEVRPDGTTTTHHHEFFSVETFDAEGHHGTITRDVDGRVVKTVSYAGYGNAPPLETTFQYAPFGLLEQVLDANQNPPVLMGYDERGRKKWISDPDAGVSLLSYNGFGEVREMSDVQNGPRTFERDSAGRLVKVVADGPGGNGGDGTTTFTWDQAVNGIGQLSSTLAPDGTTTTRQYDAAGRLKATTWEVDPAHAPFSLSFGYDSEGRVDTVEYPAVAGLPPFKVTRAFTHNYVREVSDTGNPGGASAPVWTVKARNADDALTAGMFGVDILSTERAYDATGGQLTGIAAHAVAAPDKPLLSLAYHYDDDGFVDQRTDQVLEQFESFGYDGAHRVQTWTLQKQIEPQGRITEYGYDEIGNLTDVHVDGLLSESNFYSVTRPHALETAVVGGVAFNYGYDDRGRQDQSPDRTVDYTTFDLPKSITTAGVPTTFGYDAHRARVKKTGPAGTIISIGGLYELHEGPNGTEHVFRVPGTDGSVAEVVYDPASGSLERRFVLADGLGSSSVVADESGTVIERLFFDPFGRRIDSDGEPVDAAKTTQHGFTGHRHDDELGLIDMRGRIYDPHIRRFLTPDPLVSDPLFGQAYNRYSYVLNNPVNLTDPTGFIDDGGGGGKSRPDSGPDVHTYGPCGAGGCGVYGNGRTAGGGSTRHHSGGDQGTVAVRSDQGGYSNGGCPRSTGGTALGPCPPGQVGSGCGGAPGRFDAAQAFAIGRVKATAALNWGVAKTVLGMAVSLDPMATGLLTAKQIFRPDPDEVIAGAYREDGILGATAMGLNKINPAYQIARPIAGAVFKAGQGDELGANEELGEGATVAGAMFLGARGGGSVRGFHGTVGDNVLGIMDKGGFIPKNGKVFLSEIAGDTFVHGADMVRGAAFAIEVEIEGAGAVSRTSVPGNARTIVIESSTTVRATVRRLLVRTKNSEGEFGVQSIEGEAAIRAFLAQ